jgi:hypothetical protein
MGVTAADLLFCDAEPEMRATENEIMQIDAQETEKQNN